MMNSVIFVLLACVVLEKTLANPHAYIRYGEKGNGNENNGDGDEDNDDNGNTSSSDDSDDSDDNGENKNNGNNEVCRETFRALCFTFTDRDKTPDCVKCFEYFDDEIPCLKGRNCVWDSKRKACVYSFY
nr:surface protein P12p-like [Crassostrea gigas]|eukprot:XP_011428721.1 PREDICTED: surface protein P12p-like [Crassostrea gigas]